MIDPARPVARLLRRVGGSAFARRVLGPHVLAHLDRVVHRATRGRVVASDLLFPTLVLTTTGRRSGRPRTTPLARLDLDGTPVVIASNFGRDAHPAWSLNLLADPHAVVDEHGNRRDVVARPLTADERARVWPQATALWPAFQRYREATDGVREIRMFGLERRA